MSVRDRLHEKKFTWHMKQIASVKSKPFCRMAWDGHFQAGLESKHRLDGARKITLLIRLKLNRC